jgi:hypothetical protein
MRHEECLQNWRNASLQRKHTGCTVIQGQEHKSNSTDKKDL